MHQKSPLLLLLLWLLMASAYGQEAFTLTADSLQNGSSVELSKLPWKYQASDDPQIADPQFDDRAWETLNGTAITLDNIPKSGWHGIGWFRLRFKADPALTQQALALVMVHFGASEIYVDGKLVQRFGTVGTTPESEVAYNPNTLPLNIALDGRAEHVLALRYSCMAMRDRSSWWDRLTFRIINIKTLSRLTNGTSLYGAGFGVKLMESNQALTEYEILKSVFGFGIGLSVGFCLSLGLLHLLLYCFFRQHRANLFYGLWVCTGGALPIAQHLITAHYGATAVIGMYSLYLLSIYISWMLFMAFAYTMCLSYLPRRLWVWPVVPVFSFLGVLFGLPPLGGFLIVLVALVDLPLVVIQGIRKDMDGAWIVGAMFLFGILVYFGSAVYVSRGGTLPLIFGVIIVLGVTLPISIFLARQFARTSRTLAAKLVQVEQLSAKELEHQRLEAELRLQHAQEKAENERRAKELEEARQLQLSMLPKTVPQLPGLEIAAYMKTATEVGGDYYDFHLGEDGTLTIAVGDATGHGLKAGTMVTATKSLFDTLAYHPDITHIFERLSRTLKRMNLRGLFMAMTIVKVNGRQLSVGIAGMPPVLIYRAAHGEVEEISLKAIPLGGITNYQYRQLDVTLNAGDVVVLMSDGLPERMNAESEMLDYAATRQAFTEAARHCPQQIIEHLVRVGDEWADGRAQDDDVTFVVFKVNAQEKESV